MITMKYCAKCGISKPFSDFYKHKHGKYGLTSWCKRCMNEHNSTYYHSHLMERRAHNAKYREEHKEELNKHLREYRKNNKDKINQDRLKRLHTDLVYRERERCRNRLQYAFKWYGKPRKPNSKTEKMVGCALDDLCKHLISTWEKRYKTPWNGQPYNIDHIIPLCSAKSVDDVHKLCYYTNLQLLTPEDNAEKRKQDLKNK